MKKTLCLSVYLLLFHTLTAEQSMKSGKDILSYIIYTVLICEIGDLYEKSKT